MGRCNEHNFSHSLIVGTSNLPYTLNLPELDSTAFGLRPGVPPVPGPRLPVAWADNSLSASAPPLCDKTSPHLGASPHVRALRLRIYVYVRIQM